MTGFGAVNLRKFFTRERIIFLVIFAVIALIAMRINFSSLLGAENQFFTLFQFFGPIAGAFLGPIVGSISIFSAEIGNFFLVGKEINIINLFRLAPMVFAAFYFGTKGRGKITTLVPLIAIAAFWLHPIGIQVWYFALFWTIPLIVKFLPDRLFFRALGTTFTAHAVGGMLWIYTVPVAIMTVQAWQILIPIVMYERILFALGITAAYLGFNTLLSKVFGGNASISKYLHLNPKYILGRKLFAKN